MFLKGFKNVTKYKWSFGDNATTGMITGYSAARTTSHAYNYPGTYQVTVSALNDGGHSVAVTQITIIGRIEDLFLELLN